jgi:hypothetical protein
MCLSNLLFPLVNYEMVHVFDAYAHSWNQKQYF